ncbi:Pex29p Ecym_5585 [Eremothecium cymbalariae DBVPG|uniref:TECPR1-like DysF domain-containing protein n=1 Tax=Eremothecium cymbalariae (strain CBS 270.75 / DBVPG 7215 / KCTC 17166 / NRRL Y-17582) TaxID=931890 RepID=I6NE31_ERECY|nr:hypothetical protein Ecym_5585 [Eremothecium cymbalariae DBVPG\
MEVVDTVANFFWEDRDRKVSIREGDNKSTSTKYNNREGSKSSFTLAMDSLWGLNSKDRIATGSKSETNQNSSSSGVQGLLIDKLVEKVINMAIPSSSDIEGGTIETRMQAGKSRPGLSVPIMSRNFIQLNSRLSWPFRLVNELIRIANWESPAYTLCIAFLFSFVVLKPVPMLSSVPVFYILFVVMVPFYMSIHTPETWEELGPSNPIPALGPPLKKAEIPKPVPELSKEFILNLTDLQNHMVLYVFLYDFFVGIFSRFAFFTNESISAATFVGLFILAVFNILFMGTLSEWIPFRFLILVSGWCIITLSHPSLRHRFLDYFYSEETRLRLLTLTDQFERIVDKHWDYYEPNERRQAAIFEVQMFNERAKAWELAGYSQDDYTLLSKLRIAEMSIDSATLSLDDVKAPQDWEWIEKYDWVLDLAPKKWVVQGFVQYVDIDLETKWVYDINFDGSRGQYRRRRWIRICTRKRHTDNSKQGDVSDEEDEDGLEFVDFNGYTGVSQNSLHGSTRSNATNDASDLILTEKRNLQVSPSRSNASPLNSIGITGAPSFNSAQSPEEGSKAVKSLTGFFNIHS